jgi:hypothetical protein
MSSETWHTGHPTDNRRFYAALGKVVWSDQFNPDLMASYMREKKKIPLEDRKSEFAKTIDQCCHDAWAIKDFLECNDVAQPAA